MAMVNATLSTRQRSAATALRQPREFGHYSRTIDGTVHVNDDRALSYYYFTDDEFNKNKNKGIDLTVGRRQFQDRAQTIGDTCSLQGLLATVQQSEARMRKRLNADIITFRGIVRKLVSCAFAGFNSKHRPEPLEVAIMVFDGQLFIKDQFQETKDDLASSSYGIDMGSYSGYKFETLTTLPRPFPCVTREYIEDRGHAPVTNGNEYVTVVRTGIGNCKMVLGAEVDAIYDFEDGSDPQDNLPHYVELKCTREVVTERDCRNFESKLFKTWLQCFLVGIPRIVYGFRDNNYRLTAIEEYSTMEVPQVVGKNDYMMSEQFNDAIRWYGCLTEWLLTTIPRGIDNDDDIYTLTFEPEARQLRLVQLERNTEAHASHLQDEGLVSTEFREWRRSLRI